MGIPSFFSYIIKNHPEIIKQFANSTFNNFYLDSNSIIYDSLREIEYCSDFEEKLIKNVCEKIDKYIDTISPDGIIYIAFDGVAPVAKLEQQRTRRYKSSFETQLGGLLPPVPPRLLGKVDQFNSTQQKVVAPPKKTWNKTAITPGTEFMNKLDKYIHNHYRNSEKKLGVKKIIISTSTEIGEGEHKIFQFIRNNPELHKTQTTLVYGLDADLIMLGLNHLPVAKKIYLFRETPEFIKSINSNFIPNENYILDLPELAKTIISRMNNYKSINKKQLHNRLYDYIFLCFFLGNDFLPHFPSINIRTSGIEILLDAYSSTIGKTDDNLTNGKTIFWNNVYKFVKYLAKNEYENLKKEYKIRERWERRKFRANTVKEKLMKLQNIPTYERDVEKYIDPHTPLWEKRYYEKLFYTDINNEYKKKVCINYLEGLEWVISYYTTDCVDWRWHYKYHYPPLLNDLLLFIPHFNTRMIEKNNHKAVHPYVQLSYVLPLESLNLLPYQIYIKLIREKKKFYDNNCDFVWAFCKYFWESHVKLPMIDLDELEQFVEKIKL